MKRNARPFHIDNRRKISNDAQPPAAGHVGRDASRGGYGNIAGRLNGPAEFLKTPGAALRPGALARNLASTFKEKVYILVKLQRAVRVYRGFETAGLQAPFGRDHPSFIKA